MKKDYQCQLMVNVSAKAVFEGISSVSAWWATHFEGSATQLNDVFTVRWGETFVTFKLTESVPNKKVMWAVTECYLPWLKDTTEWNGTKVLWEVTDNGDSAQIHFTHIGLAPEVECYGMCSKGWDQYVLGSLPKLLVDGKGLPN